MFISLFVAMLAPASVPAAAEKPVRFMLQGTNAAAIAAWPENWRLNGTFPFVSYTVATPPRWEAVATRAFDSYAALTRAVDGGTIEPGVRVLLYDNERWPLTPPDEQAQPAYYEAAFCALAHAAGYLCMTAPAFDLITPTPGQTQYESYFSEGFPQFSASVADFYAIQAQGYQSVPTLYASIVEQAAADAFAVRPPAKLRVLGSLSTNPNPNQGTPTVSVLVQDVTETRASLNGGYWLNIPTPGIGCPHCAPPNVALAESLVQALDR